MKILIALKLLALTVTLAFVIWAMKSLNAESVSRFLTSVGIEPGAHAPSLQPGNKAEHEGERLNLCRTRVRALIWPDGRRIEEEINGLDMSWKAHDPAEREVSYLEMEKWLSQHCQVTVQPRELAQGETLEFNDHLTVRFIDGVEAVIQLAQVDGTYRIDGKIFRSDDLRAALSELRQIAQFKDPAQEPKAP